MTGSSWEADTVPLRRPMASTAASRMQGKQLTETTTSAMGVASLGDHLLKPPEVHCTTRPLLKPTTYLQIDVQTYFCNLRYLYSRGFAPPLCLMGGWDVCIQGKAPGLENAPSHLQDWEIIQIGWGNEGKNETPTSSHNGSLIVSNSCSRNSAFVFAGFSLFFPFLPHRWNAAWESKGPCQHLLCTDSSILRASQYDGPQTTVTTNTTGQINPLSTGE